MSFSHAIALSESQPGHYAGQIAEGWDIGGNANGGYLLALAANGLRQHLGRPDPVSITAHYLRPGKVGDAAVHCETVKEGKRFATARATLEGPGGAVLSVLGTFGNLEDGAVSPTQVRLEPPALPAVDDCFPLGSGSGEGFAPSLMDRIDARLHPEDAGFRNGESRGIPEMRGYFRLPDEDPCSVLGLLLGLDAFPPTIFNANLPVAWTPTVELTCHLRRRPAPGWLRARFVTRVISSGFLEEDGELWDSTGQLVAQSRQLALVPKVAAPLMGALAQRLKPVLMPALLALLLALLPGRAWLPGDWRLVEGLTAFTPQWLALTLALGVRALWRGQRLRALVFVLLAAPDLVSALRPDAGRPDAGRLAAPGTDFTLYAANLGEDPAALGVALETLQATAPDVIWLSEVPATRPAALEEAFDVMAAAYPYGMAWAPAPGRELRFLSRFPLRAREEFNPERARGRPGMRLVLDVQGQLLTVYALHTHPPTQAWSLKARNEALSWVGARVAASDGPVLVLGDLNTSAFSPFFRGWIRDSGLRCPSPWTCATGTWPAPWRPLVTPIDHVLAKGALQVQSLKRGPATGSDHYPLQAELTLEAPQP